MEASGLRGRAAIAGTAIGVVLLLIAAPADAILGGPSAVDLSTGTDARIDGAAAGERTGFSVGAAGDVNADGVADVIVGAPGAGNNGRADSGSAYVVFGPVGNVDLAGLGAGGFRIDGPDMGDNVGESVRSLGDVNGDGLDDLAVGFGDEGDTVPGAAYVVFGKASSAPVDLAALGAGGLRIDGDGSSDRAGLTLAGGGDVNGDGEGDLVASAPFAGTQGRNDNGAVYAIFGPFASGVLKLANLGAGGFRIDGTDDNHFLGETGVAMADVNGDGRSDVLAAAPMNGANGRANSGSAYVVFGKASSAAVDTAALGASGFRIDGAAANDMSGSAVGTVADMTGDGRDEALVGAANADNNGRAESGTSYVVFGKASTAAVDLAALGAGGRRIDGPAAAGMLGDTVTSAGDIERDGRGDLLTGSALIDNLGRAGAGAAYAISGRPVSSPLDLLALGADGWRLDGAASGDSVGGSDSLGSAGDLGGNGRDGVLAGAPMADNNARADSGSVHVLLPPAPAKGKCANPLFGSSASETLNGTDAGDKIKAEGGKDKVKGREGKDCLIGGDGNDVLNGGKAKDSFKGGDGNDKIKARDGKRKERINCGAGKRDKVTADKGDKPKRNCERVKLK